MVSGKAKVFVAISGGVDSSTAAALLCERGFDCSGVYMVTSEEGLAGRAAVEGVADELGIKLYVLDVRGDFERIVEYFCDEYKRGRTPNPCVLCNRHIKFGRLWDFARLRGADYFATGHYARIMRSNGEVGLYEAVSSAKDQSYVLSMLDRKVLARIILPMGEHNKDEVRAIAGRFGLSTSIRSESQEICFIPGDDYVALLERRCPELVRKGKIVDSSGDILGEHMGVHRFTVGQRRGLGVAMGRPCYVVKIDAENNTVTLGPKEEVMSSRLVVKGVNWLTRVPVRGLRARVKIRYNGKGADATVTPEKDGAVVEFDEPISAITPGQLAAFYVEDGGSGRVVGCGWIDGADA
jgi:tRNA-specific 2-thiouridylase